MDLLHVIQRIKLDMACRREYRRVYSELSSHTERQMNTDLGLCRSDIAEIAAKAALSHRQQSNIPSASR